MDIDIIIKNTAVNVRFGHQTCGTIISQCEQCFVFCMGLNVHVKTTHLEEQRHKGGQ